MSRSHKKSPFISHCTLGPGAQKAYRSQENRSKRRQVKIRLVLDKDMPHEKEYGNEWSSPRDGRSYWALTKHQLDMFNTDNWQVNTYTKWMRK